MFSVIVIDLRNIYNYGQIVKHGIVAFEVNIYVKILLLRLVCCMEKSIKKVLVCITLPGIGGAQQVVYDIISGLNPNKFQITLATSSKGNLTKRIDELNEHRTNKIKVIIIPSIKREISLINDIKALYALYSLMRTNKYDIVHLHSSKVGILGRYAARIAGVPKVFFTVHGWGIEENLHRAKQILLGLAERIAGRLCTRVICVSCYDFNRGITSKWILKDKACVIHNGVENFESNGYEQARKNDAGTRKLVIGTIMRLQQPKDPLFTIKVFQGVKARFGDQVRLMIVGDGKLRSECLGLVESLGLEEDVEILGECENARNLIWNFDIFTLFSKSEGLPLSIIEAMIAGKPVVASAVGGIPELVDNNENGLLVKGTDVLEAVQCIEKLIMNADKRARMGSKGRERASLYFGKMRMVTAYESMYLSIE